jgi:siroheme synthase (precorrin-2 oxidase/ferrochelatase)
MKWLLLLLLSTSLHAENLTVRIESPDEDYEHYTLQSFQTEDLSTCKGMMRNISSKLEDEATAVMTCSNTETLNPEFHVQCQEGRCYVMVSKGPYKKDGWVPWKNRDRSTLEHWFKIKPYERW